VSCPTYKVKDTLWGQNQHVLLLCILCVRSIVYSSVKGFWNILAKMLTIMKQHVKRNTQTPTFKVTLWGLSLTWSVIRYIFLQSSDTEYTFHTCSQLYMYDDMSFATPRTQTTKVKVIFGGRSITWPITGYDAK
jgi:hypothetical protein